MPDNLVLSPTIWNRLRKDIKGTHLVWLIDLFIRELPNYMVELENAVASRDGEQLYLIAHKFKGASSNMGAVKLVELCQQLEILGRAGDLQQAESLVTEELSKESERFKNALEQERQNI
jgi:HPt (histidine-containing phosphotransfer) domain-containing protein